MAEYAELPVPLVKQRTRWKLTYEVLHWGEGSATFTVVDDNLEPVTAHYPTPAILNPLGVLQPTGRQVLQILNTADLTTNSHIRRVLNRLISDGYILGTVSGTPE